MRVLLILILMGLAYWSLATGWGILTLLFVVAIGALIITDKQGRSIDKFFAACFAITILGGAAGLIRHLLAA